MIYFIEVLSSQRRQWQSPTLLQRAADARLHRTVAHAYNQVPFYREQMQTRRLRPEDVQTAADLQLLPVTTRKDLQSRPLEEIVAGGTDLQHCKRITTSGSSGTPLTILQSRTESGRYDISWGRASLAGGQRLWDTSAALKYHCPQGEAWFQRLGIWKRLAVSVADDISRQTAELEKARPAIIKGNPFDLVLLARHLLASGRRNIRPRAIFAKGSTLAPADRQLLEEAFGCPVLDYYGATEFGLIAWQCPARQGYHVNSDSVVVELLDEHNRPVAAGEAGRVICTSLVARTMPFIRHDTGDMAVAGADICPCGRGFRQMLRCIEGRKEDFLVRHDGALLSPSVFVNRIKFIPGVARFKITQKSEDRLEVLLERSPALTADAHGEIRTLFTELLGETVAVSVQEVNEITREPGGKWRCVESRMAL